jgi:hypothetical protein
VRLLFRAALAVLPVACGHALPSTPVPQADLHTNSGEVLILSRGPKSIESSERGRLDVATNERGFITLWRSYAEGTVPTIDFSRWIVVGLQTSAGEGCSDISFLLTSDRRLLPEVAQCGPMDVAEEVVFVTAVARSALPQDGFVLSLDWRSNADGPKKFVRLGP